MNGEWDHSEHGSSKYDEKENVVDFYVSSILSYKKQNSDYVCISA
jgi:hypothetical protein